MLRYAGASLTLPTTPILQPESVPAWSFGTVSAVWTPFTLMFSWVKCWILFLAACSRGDACEIVKSCVVPLDSFHSS